MEDLYGKTINKSVTPLELAKSATVRSTNFASLTGRITPVETNNKSARQQSAFSGRLTPIDTSLSSTKGGGRPAAGHGYSHGTGLLNVSSHNSSKLSSSNSGSNVTKTTADLSHHELNSTQISPISARGGGGEAGHAPTARRPLVDSSHSSSHINGGLNISRRGDNETLSRDTRPKDAARAGAGNVSKLTLLTAEAGVKEMIQSLGLLCLVSLLLALGSLVFLLKILPAPPGAGGVAGGGAGGGEQFLSVGELGTVHHVTVAMCGLTLSLNLSCLLVCAIQFLFAAKLVKSTNGRLRTTKYLKKAAITRTCAIAGFFLSIPLFLIGIVLFTFLHFNETPAIVTSVVIGLGIVFCGGAVIHNVFIWQREKTTLRRGSAAILNGTLKEGSKSRALSQSHIVLPHATLDLSNGFNGTIMAKSLELSTLV